MPIGADKFPELPFTVNEMIADRVIRHALYLERYKSSVVVDLLKEFNQRLGPQLTEAIEKNLRKVTAKNKVLQELFKTNGELVREEYALMQSRLYAHAKDFSVAESLFLVNAMQSASPIAFDFVLPAPSLIKNIIENQAMNGALVKTWFGKLSTDTAFAVNRQIQMGVIEGQGIDAIVRRIKGTKALKYSDGILNKSRHELQAIVRTSIAHVAEATSQELYAANQDVIKGVEIIGTLDSRTCIECMNQDGKVYQVDEGPRPAFHFNCRCKTVPVLKSWKELGIKGLGELPPGTRSSSAITTAEKKRIRKLPKEEREAIKRKLEGQIPATLKYPEWIKRQKADVQNEALGVNRAKLLRSGKVTFKQFFDRKGSLLTLDELMSKID
ncbi:MAG: minor capsid protein [Sedimentisphaerales bacterium]|nr:minor capsid protein [Sedimentisphaerales bacterium]